MAIRERIANDKTMGMTVAALLILVAAVTITAHFWPQKRPKLSMAYFSTDDGKTWFEDSAYLIPPVDHDGKPAYLAEIYTYDNGSKQFCAYLAQYTPEAKRKLESAVADAQSKSLPLDSIELFHDPAFIRFGMEAKLPGSSNAWISYSSPQIGDIFSIHSPDGSAVDQVFVY